MGNSLASPVCNQTLTRTGDGRIRAGAADMQGYRQSMEDATTVQLSLDRHPNCAFFGVFDGHGGEEAANYCKLAMNHAVAACEDPMDQAQIRAAILKVDADFLTKVEHRDHGTTCIFAVVEDTGDDSWRVLIANVGDSRALLVRQNGEMVEMSEDHKPNGTEERRRIVAAGGHVVMDRVDGDLALSRAIGDWEYKSDADLTVEQQKVIPTPDFRHEVVRPGDFLLLFCDGLVEAQDNRQVAEYARVLFEQHADDPALVASKLIMQSLEAGSKDNHSAIIVQFRFEADGTAYVQSDEYRAGPYDVWAHDQAFAEAYRKDAANRGQSDVDLALLELPDVPTGGLGPRDSAEDVSVVMEGLWLGSASVLKNPAWFRANRITHVVSACAEAPDVSLLKDLFFNRVARGLTSEADPLLHLQSAKDRADFPLSQHFAQTCRFIHLCRSAGGSVLVHCEQGVSRSATLVAAYLLAASPEDTGRTWTGRPEDADTAVALVRTHRPVASPNPGFVSQLRAWATDPKRQLVTDPSS